MDVYQIKGVGLVPVGTVVSGTLYPQFVCWVNGKTGTVKSIEANHEQLPCADAGKNIGFVLDGLVKTDLVKGQEVEFRKK